MKITLLAVGHRMPHWVDAGFQEYARRMPRTLPVTLREIKPAARAEGGNAAQWIAAEETRLRAALPEGAWVVLDERGETPTTAELARRITRWQEAGRELAFVIGGADGTSQALRDEAATVLALSRLTLPHGLCRVVLAEQLYRASTLLAGHPYHRE